MRVPRSRSAAAARLVGLLGLVGVLGLLGLVGLVGLVGLAGCGTSAQLPADLPTPDRGSAPPPAPDSTPVPVRVPEDGITLASLGFEHGPIGSFSLPRSAVISTRVDQPNAVTVVLSAPSTSAIARYLSRALPLTGYRVTAATPSATAIIFTGYGWEGSFTGTAQTAAIALRR